MEWAGLMEQVDQERVNGNTLLSVNKQITWLIPEKKHCFVLQGYHSWPYLIRTGSNRMTEQESVCPTSDKESLPFCWDELS